MKNSKESSFDFYEDIIIPQSERLREFSDWSEKVERSDIPDNIITANRETKKLCRVCGEKVGKNSEYREYCSRSCFLESRGIEDY
jgi:hypothetical protein